MNMKHLAATCLLLALSAASAAAADDVTTARGLWLRGKYAEAAEIYGRRASEDPAAAIGLARCLEAQGQGDEAIARLTASAAGHAGVTAELARFAFERGDYAAAKTRVDEAVGLDESQLLARWIQAELDRVSGRLEEAGQGHAWLVSYYNDHRVEEAESLRWIGRAAAQYARWNRLSDQFDFLVNELYPEALKLEPAYWPAHYEAGLLFLEKHNQADAAREFQAALELNPNAAEVHVARARLALGNRDVDAAESAAARALEINPRLLAGWLLKVDLAWANFDVPEALQLLEQNALPLNPVDEATLGRLAACYLLLDGALTPDPSPASGRGESLYGPSPASGRGEALLDDAEDRQPTRFSRLVREVTARNAHAGKFFFTLAMQLGERNKLAQARSFFLESIERMPQLLGPPAELGLLWMRAGDEQEARRWLDRAFKDDPFNVRVSNTLEVLEVLDTMETLETEHFVLKYDVRCDRLLARYAAERLEAIYPAWCEQFGYRPAEKPRIEIFSSAKGTSGQDWFSTRLIGLPYLGIVAASTGPLIAMASPNDGPAARQLNWARVLKHELAHVITLQQTDYNIPHWYTEGIAVVVEGSPRPQLWNELLLERVPTGKLFNLRTLNFGFTRPQNSQDWQMAYCQAELYVEYMRSSWGPGPMRKLLTAYRDGLSTPAAIDRAFGVSQEKFEQGYVEYLRQTIAGMSTLKQMSGASFEQLLASHRERPGDADTAAELAYAYVIRDADEEAGQLAQDVLKEHPKHPLAAYVAARLLVKQKRPQEAAELLQDCLDPESPQPNSLNLLATLRFQAEAYDEAARLYALGERLDPVNRKWTKALARVYLRTENAPRLTEVLTRLARADVDDVTSRKKLAQLALGRKDYAGAAGWANQAMEIDVMDANIHQLFAEALLGSHNNNKAVEEFQIADELDPDQPFRLYELADACIEARQFDKARRTLEALLRLVPNYPGAQQMLETAKETEPE